MEIATLLAKLEKIDRLEQILLSIDSKLNNQSPSEIGGIELAQKKTGLSKSRIYQLVMSRKIPFNKVPGVSKLFFSSKSLDDWIEGKTNTSN
jgi:hypothetical protein